MTTDIPFVDSHVHFWDRPHPTLRWVWLEPDFVDPGLGEITYLKELHTYTPPEFLAEADGCKVTKVVHVQAAIGTEDPVEETKWLQGLADATGFPQAIIGDARMQREDIRTVVERHLEYPNFRGIRDFAEGDYLVDPAFHRGYAVLEDLGLVYDLDVTWEDMHKAADLARRFPGVTLVVDHTGYPKDRTPDYFANWRTALDAFIGIENVAIKISGLGMGNHLAGVPWSPGSIRPYVESALEVFGVERSFFGSNFPVDAMYSPYRDLVGSYRDFVSGFSRNEQSALLHGNAERVYRI